MGVTQFDEKKLSVTLKRLPSEMRVLFAAACAARQMPAYKRFYEQTHEGDPTTLEGALETAWVDPGGTKVSRADLQRQLDRCMAIIPQEGVIASPWTELATFAQNAGMSVAYTLRVRISGESQEAAWSARVAYEALDHFVINHEVIDTNLIGGEERVVSHPLIQAELLRQQRDLDGLLAVTGKADMTDVGVMLRMRAEAEGEIFFAHSL